MLSRGRPAIAMKASIVICTYNRSKSLARTLDTLAAQSGTDWEGIEVIVVDNNSTDDTKEIVESFAATLPVGYVRESRQGLAFARNRGVAEARSDFVLFTDDDVRLDDKWLGAYLKAASDHPDAGFFGGRIVPDWQNTPKPRWLRDERMALLRGILVAFDFGEETRAYREGDEGPVGASFGVRRRLFDEIGRFRTDLGVIGTSRGRGEDTEFLSRARVRGAQGVYVGEALCWHRVDPKRLILLGLFRHGLAKGKSHETLTGDPTKGSTVRAVNYLIRGLYQLMIGRGDRFRQCIINVGMEFGRK